MERARRYLCTIPSPGQVSCDAEIATAPRIEIDEPVSGATLQGAATVRGWAVDKASSDETGVIEAHVRVNGTFVGAATYGESRPDVATYLGDRRYTASQYRHSFDTRQIPSGSATLQVSYHIYRTLSYTIQGAARTTTIDQWHAVERPVTVSNAGYALMVYNDPNYSSTWCYSDSPIAANIQSTCNDQISSIQLHVGWSVRLYREVGQSGSNVCLATSDPNLADNTFADGSPLDNAISSFELFNQANCPPARQPTYALEVYSGAGFTSNWCYSDSPISANIHSTCNDRISSILLRSGWSVRLYRDVGRSGPTACLTASDSDLADNSFEDGSRLNDAVSSFTLYNQSNCPPLERLPTYPLEVFNDVGYAGARCFSTGAETANFHASCAGQISSLLLARGWSIRLYRDVNQSGPSACLTGSDPTLLEDSFEGGSPLNDAIRSFALYAQASCPPTQEPSLGQRVIISSDQGFDTCAAPSEATMQAWSTSSPYDFVGIYIGGSVRGCRQDNLNATWVARVGQQGWSFVPIWVGPQAPCTGYHARISSDPATARSEGVREATAAVEAARRLGLTTADGTGSIIYYDMENFDTQNAGCRAAVTAFMSGWTQRLHELGDQAGAYGSACGSAVADWAGSNPAPDAAWIAAWYYPSGQGYYTPNVSTFGISCVSNALWANNQRLRQYLGGHKETWGGVTITIDSNKATGPVAAVSGSKTSTAAAAGSQVVAALAAPNASARTIGSVGLVSPTQGWALIDQHLRWTTTGGASWVDITPSIAGLMIHAVTFTSPSHGWLTGTVPGDDSGKMVLLTTADGGKTWSQQALPVAMSGGTPTLPIASHVQFLDNMTGWIVYQLPSGNNFSLGTLLRTRDGGATWTQHELPIGEPVRFISVDVGWVAGGVAGDSLYITRDGGVSWAAQEPIPQAEMTEQAVYQLPTFVSSQEGYLPMTLSRPGHSRVMIYRTTDSGQTWALHAEQALSSSVEQGVSVPVAILSADKQVVAEPAGSGSLPAGVTEFVFASPQSGWAVAASGSCVAGSTGCAMRAGIYQTTDGGQTWSALNVPLPRIFLPLLSRP